MRFGVLAAQGWKQEMSGVEDPGEQWPAVVESARKAERLGYDSVWVYDHFHTIPEPTQQPTFECWSTMAALSQVTERVRLGQMVTCNSYRNPAYLAKVAACVDVMSGGRLDFGIGAGWYEDEYRAYGYPFPEPATRIAEMAEGVEIVKAMWTRDRASYRGEHYTVDRAICRPKPLQDPHPPVWIGGGGEQLTLREVARHADFANFGFGDPEEFRHKKAALERHCEAVGRPIEEIGLTTHVIQFLVAEDETALRHKIDRFVPAPWTVDQVRQRGFLATVDQAVDRLGRLQEAGCRGVQLFFMDVVGGDGMDLFAEEVMPRFR